MRRIGIVGGETHINEVTALNGTQLEIAAAAVRPDQADWATQQFGCDVLIDMRELVALEGLDMTAVANENDLKQAVVDRSARRDPHPRPKELSVRCHNQGHGPCEDDFAIDDDLCLARDLALEFDSCSDVGGLATGVGTG